MDAGKINPFIQGAQMVINTVCLELPKLGQVFVKKNPYTTMPVTVAITIIGDFTGEVVFNMDEEVGCFIASRMMGGMPVPALDEMSQSAVSEMANMISGNVATIFSGKGLKIDIKPPRFKANPASADFPLAPAVEKIVCVPLIFADGHIFELDIFLPA
jgi:chemotaxis protein CheX